MNIKSKKGFTLFELLISISIVGILTALAVVSYSGSQLRARNQRRVEDLNMIQKAAEQYYAAHYTYPASAQAFYSNTDKVLEAWPADPKNTATYNYQYTKTQTSYCVCATMEAINNVGQGNSQKNCGGFVTVNPDDPTTPVAPTDYYCVKGQQE